jgi:hypothetical protein
MSCCAGLGVVGRDMGCTSLVALVDIGAVSEQHGNQRLHLALDGRVQQRDALAVGGIGQLHLGAFVQTTEEPASELLRISVELLDHLERVTGKLLVLVIATHLRLGLCAAPLLLLVLLGRRPHLLHLRILGGFFRRSSVGLGLAGSGAFVLVRGLLALHHDSAD